MLSRHWRGGGPKRERIEIAINLLRAELTGTTFAELTGTDFEAACDRAEVPGRRSEARTRITRDFTKKLAEMLSGSEQTHVTMRKLLLPSLPDSEIAALTSAWLSERKVVDAEKAALPRAPKNAAVPLLQPIALYASRLPESPQPEASAIKCALWPFGMSLPHAHQDEEQVAKLLKVGAELRAELGEAHSKTPPENVVLRTSYQDLIDAIDRFAEAQGMPRAPLAIGALYSDDMLVDFLNSPPSHEQHAEPPT